MSWQENALSLMQKYLPSFGPAGFTEPKTTLITNVKMYSITVQIGKHTLSLMQKCIPSLGPAGFTEPKTTPEPHLFHGAKERVSGREQR